MLLRRSGLKPGIRILSEAHSFAGSISGIMIRLLLLRCFRYVIGGSPCFPTGLSALRFGFCPAAEIHQIFHRSADPVLFPEGLRLFPLDLPDEMHFPGRYALLMRRCHFCLRYCQRIHLHLRREVHFQGTGKLSAVLLTAGFGGENHRIIFLDQITIRLHLIYGGAEGRVDSPVQELIPADSIDHRLSLLIDTCYLKNTVKTVNGILNGRIHIDTDRSVRRRIHNASPADCGDQDRRRGNGCYLSPEGALLLLFFNRPTQKCNLLSDGIIVVRDTDKLPIFHQSRCLSASYFHNYGFQDAFSPSLNGFRYSARCGKSPVNRIITATRYFR